MSGLLDKLVNSLFFGSKLHRRKSLDKMREKRNSRLEEVYGVSAKRASFEQHPYNGHRIEGERRPVSSRVPPPSDNIL